MLQLPVCTQGQNPDKPNVILIYADDLGRGMLSCYGQKIVHTPNIDRLAEEGIRFNRVYGSQLCAPARASLLSGYTDCRPGKWKITDGGIYEEISNGKMTFDKVQLKLDSIIGKKTDIMYLPQVFKSAGYITGEVGKLEWGFSGSVQQMKNHQWDYYFGYLDHIQCHGYYPPFLFENGILIPIPGNTDPKCGINPENENDEAERKRWNLEGRKVYSEDLFIDKVKTFIEKNKSHPFFLYFPTQLPHGPVAIPSLDPAIALNNILSNTEKEYASMVTRLDADVGLIISELKKWGIEKNTIIIFTADNGHELYYSKKGQSTKPYKNMATGEIFDNVSTKFYSEIGGDTFNGNDSMAGLKRSNWEGGTRVPLIINWPAGIRKASVNNNFVASYDFISTMADLLHIKLPDQKDGISFLPLLYGYELKNEHKYVVHASFMGPAIVTNSGWKLRYYAQNNLFQLYYLPNDYREENDLSLKYPQMVDSLKKQLLEECEGDLNNGWYDVKKNQVAWY